MNYLELIFLPVILLLGIITSYQDIKFGKIKNKWIILALIYAFIAYILLITFYLLEGVIRTEYLTDLATNFLFAAAIGFGLWHFKIWSAADGKLFIAYSALVPLTAYSNSYIKFFPSLTLLVNTFVPFFIFSFFVFIVKIKNLSEEFKKIKKKEIYLLFLNLFWILWIPKLFSLFDIKLDFLSSLIIMMVLVMGLQILFKEKVLWIALFLCVLRIFFDKTLFTLVFLKQFLIFSLFILIIFFCLKSNPVIFTKTIKISELKSGMILADAIYKRKNKYALKKEREKYKKSELLDVSLVAEGLTEKEIEKIKKLQRAGKLAFSEIKIHQTLPFAPFMFVGTLLTLIVRGNFLLFLKIIF